MYLMLTILIELIISSISSGMTNDGKSISLISLWVGWLDNRINVCTKTSFIFSSSSFFSNILDDLRFDDEEDFFFLPDEEIRSSSSSSSTLSSASLSSTSLSTFDEMFFDDTDEGFSYIHT